MRARLPDKADFVERDGVKVGYEVYENDGPTILLLPTWAIVHSRSWKAQIPYLSRHFRVVTYDPRGNGRSDRPLDPRAHSYRQYLADGVAVLDATGTDRAVVAGFSCGGHWAALMAGLHPDRVMGAIMIGPVTALVGNHPEREIHPWGKKLDTDQGWAKYNRYYWRDHYDEFIEYFFSQIFSETHSTKQHEDSLRWARETDSHTLIATHLTDLTSAEAEEKALPAIECPALVIHGTDDRIRPYAGAQALAAAIGASLLTIEGGGHLPQARHPVVVNRAMRRFVEDVVGAGVRE